MNQIVFGLSWNDGDNVYVSPYEHNAVARTLNYLQKRININVRELPINKESLEIDIDKIRYDFAKYRPKAIFCTHVSNVTGYILPVKEIFDEGKKYGSINVVDTAQSLGLIDVDAKALSVDLVAFTGHKTLYGPMGIGGFVNVTGIVIDEYIVGGTGSDSLNLDMPQKGASKYEAASTNIVAIAGLNEALKVLSVSDNYKKERDLTSALIRKIKNTNGIQLHIPQNPDSHVGIVSFTVNGMSSEDVAMILDEDFDIAVRSGYHCAPFIHKYLRDEKNLGTVRVGLSVFNTMEDIDMLVHAIQNI